MGKSGKQRRHQNSTASLSPTNKHHTVPPPTTTTPRTPRRSSYRSRPTKTPPSGHRLRHRPTVDTKSSSNSADSTATGTGSFSPDCRSDQVLLPDESLNSYCHSPCSSKLSKAAAFTPPPELDLQPIITKPAATVRKTAGVKLRLRSPRISTRKSVSSGAGRGRAVVKASVDPRRDFKESMEEMIAENNIRDSKDLEELLACYLCLNSDQYHAVIINVFKQIWIDLYLPPH